MDLGRRRRHRHYQTIIIIFIIMATVSSIMEKCVWCVVYFGFQNIICGRGKGNELKILTLRVLVCGVHMTISNIWHYSKPLWWYYHEMKWEYCRFNGKWEHYIGRNIFMRDIFGSAVWYPCGMKMKAKADKTQYSAQWWG